MPLQVAACVCLFSLDKAGAIPVDTHVWQLACRYYAPHLRNKTLNKQARDNPLLVASLIRMPLQLDSSLAGAAQELLTPSGAHEVDV